jgi:type I restriction enzyme S subunit
MINLHEELRSTDAAIAPLSDLADVVSGVAKGRKLLGPILVVPYLRVANVQNGFLDLSEIKTIPALQSEIEKYKLLPDDVVLTEGGDHDKLGRGALWTDQIQPCIHQNHVFRVRITGSVLLPRFFVCYLRSRAARAYFLKCAKKTTNLASINMTQLKALPVPLPPIADQLRIASMFDYLDNLRAKRRETAQLVKNLRDAVIHKLLGDLYNNERNWRFATLSELTQKITDGVHQKPNYTPSGIPFISVKDVSTGSLRFDDCKFISESDHDQYSRRCAPQRNDILYTKVGTYGIPCLVDSDSPFSLYVSVCLIKPDEVLVNPLYLREILRSSFVRAQADQAVKGIGVPDLHLVEIKKFRIPVPPLSVQQEIALFATKLDQLQRLVATSVGIIEDLTQSVSSQFFSQMQE